jgi:HSP20 family protein
MRSRIHPVALPSESGEFAEEIRRIFVELGRVYAADSLAGECAPPLDVYETDETFEISVDLPGVDPSAVRIIVKGSAVLIAGEKAPRRGRGDSSFHLVERGYGRFARTVRLLGACDGARARAMLQHGELRLVIPKITERRGQPIQIVVTRGEPVS